MVVWKAMTKVVLKVEWLAPWTAELMVTLKVAPWVPVSAVLKVMNWVGKTVAQLVELWDTKKEMMLVEKMDG